MTDTEISLGGGGTVSEIVLDGATRVEETWVKNIKTKIGIPQIDSASAADIRLLDTKQMEKVITISGYIVGPNAVTTKNNLLGLEEDNQSNAIRMKWRGFDGGSTSDIYVIKVKIIDDLKVDLDTEVMADTVVFQYMIQALRASKLGS